jgi:DNA-binding SARP family transcriptional activator
VVVIGLRILGPFELVANDRLWKIGGPRDQVVLAMLALRANHVVSVDQLIDAVWRDDPPPTARGQIQTSISALRKLLGDAGMPDTIRTRSSGYVLELTEDDLDSARFSALVATAYRQAAQGQIEVAAETLRTALGLWRGPALDGLHSDLMRNAAAVLAEARLTAAEERVRLELELGRHASVVSGLRELIAENRWRERLYGFLMLALYRTGRQAEALEVYRQARAILIDEVGIEPGQELRELERAVLSNDRSLDLRSAGPGPADPAPEELTAVPRQLPGTVADFVGRDDDIADIVRSLTGRRSPAVRYAVPIVAISGRCGVGKSTLALRVAHELGSTFVDGHMYVDLAGPDGDESAPALLGRFLRALGVPDTLLPNRLDERVEMYRSRLAGKRVLLVLDGVTSEEQVTPLLPGSPSCGVIVTSRTRLAGLPGAHRVDVGTLDDETSTELLARLVGAQRLAREQAATAEVVACCGGLPLALRIAGARLAARPHWRIGDLARRLSDETHRLDELRHQGMAVRPAIDSAYRGLPRQARRLCLLLAMITTPDFPVWSTAALLDTGLAEAEDTVDQLVEAQMLDVLPARHGQLRYRLPGLIRVYGQERLADTDTDRRAALARLLGAWLALAETAHRADHGGDHAVPHGNAARTYLPEWANDDPIGQPMHWLAHERTGLVAAVRQAASADLDELCWNLALTSVGLFEVRGYLDEWREIAEIAHAAAVRAGNRPGTAAMLYSLGRLHLVQRRFDAAEQKFAEALELFDADGNPHGQALARCGAAVVDQWQGRYGSMHVRYKTALAGMRAVGDLVGQANVLTNMARFSLDEGDLDEAGPLLTEALELSGRAGHRRGEARALSGFADLYLRTHQLGPARRALNKVLLTVREIGDQAGEAYTLYGFGLLRREEGQLDTAEATLAHALSIAERIGDRLIAGQIHYALGELAIIRVDHVTATRYLEQAMTTFDELRSALWLAKTHLLLAEAHADAGATESAEQGLARAHELLSTIDSRQADLLLRRLERKRTAI